MKSLAESEKRPLFCFLETFINKCSTIDLKSCHIKVLLKDLYSWIQGITVHALTDYTSAEIQFMQKTVNLLVYLITCDLPPESTMLAATCFTSFVHQFLGRERAVWFLLHVLSGNLVCNHDLFSEDCAIPNHSAFETSCIIKEDEICASTFTTFVYEDLFLEKMNKTMILQKFLHVSSRKPQFYQLAVLHGVMTNKKLDYLSYEVSADQTAQVFWMLLFPLIHQLCISLCEFHFQAIQLLLDWVKSVEYYFDTFRPKSYKSILFNGHSYFASDSEVVKKIICILEGNWENPVNGVTEAVKNIYKVVFSISIKENHLVGEKKYLHDIIFQKAMMLSWQMKGKYIVLSALLPHMNVQKLLTTYPDVPSSVIMSIKANYIASAVSEVYKIIVSQIMKHDLQKGAEIWKYWFSKPLIGALTNSNELLVQNVKNYILLWTLKNVPDSYTELNRGIIGRANEALGKAILMRKAKEAEVICERDIYDDVSMLLHHNCEAVRIEVFATLCSTVKKSETVPFINLSFIKEFISVNMNIDSSSFYHGMVSQLKTLLIRIRDSSASQFTTTSKKDNFEDLLYEKQIIFIEWLANFAIENSVPGACYQRRRTCLKILHLMFDVFLKSSLENRRKDKPSKSINLMISWLQNKGRWKIFEGTALKKIFPCLFDFTDDIRFLTADLLQQYFPWTNCGLFFKDCDLNDISGLLKHSLELCKSCSTTQTDTGSLLCRIIFVKYIVQKNVKFELPQCALSDVSSQPVEDHALPFIFLFDMANIVEEQLAKVKEDFLLGASTGSVHGTLLAIQYCISNEDFLEKAQQFQPSIFCKFIHRMVSLCENIVTHMLSAMIGKAGTNAPSFEEIGRALEDASQLMKEHFDIEPCATSNKSLNDVLQQEKVSEIDVYSLSEEFQLLLSCCWHSIKNCCILVSSLVKPVLYSGIPLEEQQFLISEIMKIMSSVLLTCRHRGVIEACASALNHTCKVLLENKDFEEIPVRILDEGFLALAKATSVSVTRRSAGLALLIQSVVTSEQRFHKRKLLYLAVNKLLSVIQSAVPYPLDDKNDLPHAHAYHILKVLISDATLSDHMIQWFDKVIPVCISGFTSSVWAIRNGALQLYGVLVPRLCGQKKIKDDHSQHNMISPSQLFMLCPTLHACLLNVIKKSTGCLQTLEFGSELVPLLSLIVKLSPGEDNEVNRTFFQHLRPWLLTLLESPLWHVRCMVSVAASNIFICEEYHQEILDLLSETLGSSDTNNDRMNGLLQTIYSMTAQENCGLKVKRRFLNILMKNFSLIMEGNKYSKINEKIYMNTLSLLKETVSAQEKLLLDSDLPSTFSVEGFSSCWESPLEKSYPTLTVPVDAETIFENAKFINQEDFDGVLKCLQKKMKDETVLGNAQDFVFWRKILVSLMKNIAALPRALLLEALEFIIALAHDSDRRKELLNFDLTVTLEKTMYCLVSAKCGLSVAASCVAIVSLCLKTSFQLTGALKNMHVDFWIMIFYDSSYPRNTEIVRMQAAEFVASSGWEIIRYMSSYCTNCSESAFTSIVSLWEGTLNLLQDENDVIRRKTSCFASKFVHHTGVSSSQDIQPNIGIWGIYNMAHDCMDIGENYLHYLWSRLSNFPSTVQVLQTCKLKKSSLFVQETVNIYAEPLQLTLLYFDHLKIALKEMHTKELDLWQEMVKAFAVIVKQELLDTKLFMNEFSKEFSSASFIEYLSQPLVYLVLAKLNFQALIISDQKKMITEDSLVAMISELEFESFCVKEHLPGVITWHISRSFPLSPFRTISCVS